MTGRGPAWTTHPVRLAAVARDASPYLLTPAALAIPRSADDVAALLRAGGSLTFRSAGTSLAGQASTEGTLVDVRRHFGQIEVLDDGARVRTGPGATLGRVNARLAGAGRRLGPDPASQMACTVGGCIADNSSGMRSGTTQTAYWTVESMVVVLPSGTVVDTAATDADVRLRDTEPALYEGLLRLRDVVRRPNLRAEVERLFAMKNTLGYAVNAFLDSDNPVDILRRLMVGSEGTLGFFAEATWRTVERFGFAATGLLVFASVADAVAALPALVASGASAVELLDATSLRVAGPALADVLGGLEVDAHCALLVEFEAATAADLEARVTAASDTLTELDAVRYTGLTTDPAERGRLWQARGGLYAAVAEARPSGTLAILEDFAVPPGELTAVVAELSLLLAAHGGGDSAVIFGHAKDANLHFMVTPRLDDPASVAAHEAFTAEFVDLVLAHGGTLKAEHGTGRMMAPFVRRQYGDELYEVMAEVKRLFDPRGILAPGVLISDDASIASRGLKTTPLVTGAVGDVVNACVDCGYCEPVCPSRDLTTTPRQRISLLRAGFGLGDEGFDYGVVDTCAADSLCRLACPVGVDTGVAMKALRSQRAGVLFDAVGAGVARAWGGVTPLLGAAVGVVGVAGGVSRRVAGVVSRGARSVLGEDLIPLVGPDFPPRGQRPPAAVRAQDVPGVAGVLFASCLDEMFGPALRGSPGSSRSLLAVCEAAGMPLAVPKLRGLCCTTPWSSKGLRRGRKLMAERVVGELFEASGGGALPVVSVESSCTLGLVHLGEVLSGSGLEQFRALQIVDAVQFVAMEVLPQLTLNRRAEVMVLHPTCAAIHLGTNPYLFEIAQFVAANVLTPTDAGCCGFAGDRGFLHPELTASATRAEAVTVRGEPDGSGEPGAWPGAAFASSNHTCEIGMSRATGEAYRHVLEILAECIS